MALLNESTLATDYSAGDHVRIVGVFNVDIQPSADWVGELRIQYSWAEGAPTQSTWRDEVYENDTNFGGVVGRLVGLETEREGVWYRAHIPRGGYVSGDVTVRFSQ